MPSFTELVEWVIEPEISRIIFLCLAAYLVLLWVALMIWTTKDILSRTNNIPAQIISILLVVILNIFGLLIYLAIRPAKTLVEKFFEDLEYEALVAETTTSPPSPSKKPKKKVTNKTTTKKTRKKS